MATATADKIATWPYINTWLYDKCGWKKTSSISLCPPYSACSDFSSSALTSTSLVKESYITYNPLQFGYLYIPFKFTIPSSSTTLSNTKPSYQVYTNGTFNITITGAIATSTTSSRYLATGSTSYTIPSNYFFYTGLYAKSLTAGTTTSYGITIPAFKIGEAASASVPTYLTVPSYYGIKLSGSIYIKDSDRTSGYDTRTYSKSISTSTSAVKVSGSGWYHNPYVGVMFTGSSYMDVRVKPDTTFIATANTITVSCT